MEQTLSVDGSSDLSQRLKTLTHNFQQKNPRAQSPNLYLHTKILDCLDSLESTIGYTEYSFT